MEVLVKAAQFFLSISILVILHELGHFTFAKLFKTRVEKFYLFFDPWFSLFKIKRGETEYGIGWLPLGGYVKISGMIDESMDREQMKQPPQSFEFRSKPAWQRLMIMLGGVLVNFVVALIIYAAILFVWGDQYLPTKNVTYGIAADSLARQIGLRDGDFIASVDNHEIENFNEIMPYIVLNNSKTIQVKRKNEQININIPEYVIPRLLKDPSFISVRIPFFIRDFIPGSVAKVAGIQVEDQLVGINGEQIAYFDEFKSKLADYKNEEIKINVLRNDKPLEFSLIVPETGLLGVYPYGDLSKYFEIKKIEYGFFAAIPAGINRGFSTISDYLKQFKLLFSPKTKAYESLGGFITIGSIFPGHWNWQAFWTMTAFLSIILAIMNILPIPALDGGHVMFLVFELVTGKKPGDKFMEYAQIVGMVLLFSLLIYANANDVIKLFAK